jgi:hypothetical protein
VAPRRAATSQPPRGGKPKAGFTIAASTVTSDDEDEWISSESGAATPLDTASGDEDSGKKTPQERSPTTPVDPAGQRANGQNPPLVVPGTTPRAEPAPSRPRVQTNGFVPSRPPHVVASTARIPSSSKQTQYPQQEQEPYRQRLKLLQSEPDSALHASQHASPQRPRQPLTPPSAILNKSLSPQSPPHTPEGVPVMNGARTEPPTPTSPRSGHYPPSRARPSSARSLIDNAHHLRPHPLIRGQSFGHGDLAPLKVSSDAAQAQLSSSPPNRDTSTSPTSIRTIHTPIQMPSPGSHFSSALFRRPSTSSAHSAATLPVQLFTPTERGRTYSTVSTASTSAALSSLAHLPTRGTVSPAQNAPLVVHFPPQNSHVHPETVHTLLPPPYVTPHFTILQWRNPIRESHDKVARAREGQRSGRPVA